MIGKVRIGKNVMIGANSTLLAGIEIGDNSIIGAGTIVSKNIPANKKVFSSKLKIETM